MCLMMFAQTGYAKGSNGFIQQNEQAQIEKALAELEHLRTVRKLNAEQIDALNQKVKALEDLVAIERQRAEAYKSANAERATANTLDSERIAIYEKIVEDFKSERTRLMKERDSARRANKIWGAVGLFLGAALAVLAGRD
jgi:hypothetical protein